MRRVRRRRGKEEEEEADLQLALFHCSAWSRGLGGVTSSEGRMCLGMEVEVEVDVPWVQVTVIHSFDICLDVEESHQLQWTSKCHESLYNMLDAPI